MKAIYIKPLTELVTLNTKKEILWGEDEQPSNPYTHGGANEGNFFEEEQDDEYDPFFDE